MARTIRFHLDEHVHPAIAEGLRRRGIDVTTTAEAGLIGGKDIDHVAFALSQGRVIYTNDADFLALNAAGTAPREHPRWPLLRPGRAAARKVADESFPPRTVFL